MRWEDNYCSCYWQLKQRIIMALLLTYSCICSAIGSDIPFKKLSGINRWCCRSWYPLSVNCHTFQYFVLILVSICSAVSVECPNSFTMHIWNEYCWILMSCSLVLSADCIAAVECYITLFGICGDWTVSSVFSVHKSSIFPSSCTTAPSVCGSTVEAAHHHLLKFKFCASLAGDTWLFTNTCLSDFHFINMLPQKIFMSISMNCLFCIVMMKLQ